MKKLLLDILSMGVVLSGAFFIGASMVSGDTAAVSLARNDAAIQQVQQGKINEAKASWWGFQSEDSTAMLQAAINSGVKTLRIDRLASPWICRPLKLVSNQTIIFEEGVEVVAKRGEFKGQGDSLFSMSLVKNVTLRGEGKGATLRMNKADYHTDAYKKAEWRHGLNIKSSEFIRVENLSIVSTGGDGIYLGVSKKGVPCKDITIKKVICDDNNRQGISVISAVNLLIEDTIMRNTIGTAPESGIDFEPNASSETLFNCVMRNCVCENNAGDGYQYYLPNLTKASGPASLTMENCISRNNRRAGFSLTVGNGPENTLVGDMSVRNCTFENDGRGIHIQGKSVDGLKLVFDNTLLICKKPEQTVKPGRMESPIQLRSRVTDESPNGNIHFGKMYIKYDTIIDPLTFADHSMEGFGLSDVTGVFTIEKNGKTSSLLIDKKWCDKNYPRQTIRFVPQIPLDKAEIVPFSAVTKKPSVLKLRNKGTWLALAKKGEEVKLTFREQPVGRHDPAGVDAMVTDPSGKTRKYKLACSFRENSVVSFKAEKSGLYEINISVGPHSISLIDYNVPTVATGKGILSLVSCTGDFWFDVPKGTKEFAVRIVGQGAEKVKVTLFDPSGKERWSKDNIDRLEAWFTEEGKTPESGLWRIRFARPTEGVLEDFIVGLRGVPSALLTAPEMVPFSK